MHCHEAQHTAQHSGHSISIVDTTKTPDTACTSYMHWIINADTAAWQTHLTTYTISLARTSSHNTGKTYILLPSQYQCRRRRRRHCIVNILIHKVCITNALTETRSRLWMGVFNFHHVTDLYKILPPDSLKYDVKYGLFKAQKAKFLHRNLFKLAHAYPKPSYEKHATILCTNYRLTVLR